MSCWEGIAGRATTVRILETGPAAWENGSEEADEVFPELCPKNAVDEAIDGGVEGNA